MHHYIAVISWVTSHKGWFICSKWVWHCSKLTALGNTFITYLDHEPHPMGFVIKEEYSFGANWQCVACVYVLCCTALLLIYEIIVIEYVYRYVILSCNYLYCMLPVTSNNLFHHSSFTLVDISTKKDWDNQVVGSWQINWQCFI